MAEIGKAMVRVKGAAKVGELVEINTRIIHPNYNGRTKDSDGNLIPEHAIRKIEIFYGKDLVLAVEASTSMAKNPLLNFQFKLPRYDQLRVVWHDSTGQTFEDATNINAA